MNILRRHFKMFCLASVALAISACSSTPKNEKSATVKPEIVKPKKVAAAKIKTLEDAFEMMEPQGSVAQSSQASIKPSPKPLIKAPRTTKAIQPAAKVASKRVAVVKQSPPKVARANYVPPQPIVVAVHQKKQIQKQVNTRSTTAVLNKQQPILAPKIVLNNPALPRASAAMMAGAPIIRPATVPRGQQGGNKQRVQQLRQQQALAQRQKWLREQQLRQQQARQQQIRQQQAQAKPVIYQPQTNYSQSRLTGDFAGNPRAEAFIRMMASKHGFAPAYVAGVLSRAKATSWLRKQAYKDANPTKRTTKSKGPSWTNYRRRFITSKHINTGTAFYNRFRGSLQRAEAQYGVPAEYILGILGVETIYGGNVGKDKAIDALATMGFMNSRRGKYFTSELESYFLMTRRARLDPLQPMASWAGALGLPQFMPSNIKKYGVDYDGDGAVNLWTPHDAIGSVANYLRSHGWKPGEIAAIPAVKVGGSGYSRLKSGFKYKYSLSNLARNGLKPAYPGVSGMVNMVKLRVSRGNEYWVGGNNFYVITRYNHSSHYAMAVHQLAQEIRKRVKPGGSRAPRVINASTDNNLLMQAANRLL